jgi:hypothetical protein
LLGDSNLTLQILLADGKCQIIIVTFDLMGSRGPESCIERDVSVSIGRAGLDIASTLALGACPAAPASLAPGEPVKRRIEPAGYLKLGAGLYLLSPFPPTCILTLEHILLCGFGRTELVKFFSCLFVS